MYSRIKIFGHALHPMLVTFPIAFFTGCFILYIVYLLNHDLFWFRMAIVLNFSGIITALIAAVAGFLDWLHIPVNTKAKSTGWFHMLFNIISLVLFTICAFLQNKYWEEGPIHPTYPVIFTAIGFALTSMAGYLGGTLMQKLHIGVDLSPEQEALEPIYKANTK